MKIKNVKSYCNLPFRHMKINVNGDVTMCCYQKDFLGNVLNQSIEEIWQCVWAKEVRQFASENKLHKICEGWGGCPYINKNLEENNADIPYNEELPLSIELDLPSSHCNIGGENPDDENQACIMCPRNFKSFRDHPFYVLNNTLKIAESLKVLMPYLQTFSVLGVAEPFWRNAVFDIFDVLEFKKYKQNIMFWTFTNGSVFSDKVQDKFLDYTEASELRCSIDAGTKDTYIKIRRRDFFDTIIKNLVNYSSKRKENQKLSLFNNINKLNVNEMHLMVDIAKEVWADELFFNPTHDAGGYSECTDIMIKEEDINLYLDNQQRAEERAKEIGVKLNMYRNFKQVVKKNDELNLIQITT